MCYYSYCYIYWLVSSQTEKLKVEMLHAQGLGRRAEQGKKEEQSTDFTKKEQEIKRVKDNREQRKKEGERETFEERG